MQGNASRRTFVVSVFVVVSLGWGASPLRAGEPAREEGRPAAAAERGAPTSDPFAAPATEDARAKGDRLALELLTSLGGLARYEAIRFLSFDFVARFGERAARRHHDWDRHQGLAHVVETKDGKRVETWLRLADRSGVVEVDGARVTDPAAKKEALERAYALWVNDTYWLAAPFKVMDPGVVRVGVGEDLRLSFEQVGLTPGDRYLLKREGGRLVGWEFLLESGRRGAFEWRRPREVFGVTFHLEKTSPEGTIAFERFAASLEGSDAVFAPLVEGGR